MNLLIEISEEQRNNLILLLERVDLKGSEAIAFIELIQALNNPVEREEGQ